MKRSSSVWSLSRTPSAAYSAAVSSRAASTTERRTASRSSSESSAVPTSIRRRKRSWGDWPRGGALRMSSSSGSSTHLALAGGSRGQGISGSCLRFHAALPGWPVPCGLLDLEACTGGSSSATRTPSRAATRSSSDASSPRPPARSSRSAPPRPHRARASLRWRAHSGPTSWSSARHIGGRSARSCRARRRVICSPTRPARWRSRRPGSESPRMAASGGDHSAAAPRMPGCG